MTEQDAKKLWCPMARRMMRPNAGSVYTDHPSGTEYDARCIGSACMMWRTDEVRRRPTGKEIVVKDERGMNHFTPEMERYELGHCGLAGKP